MARTIAPAGELGSLSVSEHAENPSARRFRARGRMRVHDYSRRDARTGAFAVGPRVDITGWGSTARAAEADCRRAAAQRLIVERQRAETAAQAVTVSRKLGTVAETLLRSAEASGELAASSVAAYRQALGNLTGCGFGLMDMDIAAVRPADVTTALTLVAAKAGEKARAGKGGTGAAKTARSLLNRVYAHALAQGWVNRSPVREAPPIRAPRKRAGSPATGSNNAQEQDGQEAVVRVSLDRERALTRSERVELAWALTMSDRAKRLDVRDLVLAELAIGARIGELLALRWCDVTITRDTDDDGHVKLSATVTLDGTVDRENGRGLIRHEPKTESSVRTIPVPRRIAALLARRARARGLAEADLASCELPVFPNPGRWGRGEGFRDRSNTESALRKEFDVAGFPWLSFHGLRRAAITALADHLPIRAVSDYAGHASIRTTMDAYIGRSAVSADVAKHL